MKPKQERLHTQNLIKLQQKNYNFKHLIFFFCYIIGKTVHMKIYKKISLNVLILK
jgi:hypothetical protein